VVNLALAALLLAVLVPVATHLGRVGTAVRVVLVAVCVPFAVLVVLCLASALRPGSLGRLVRRIRSRRA
jgi:hypothetical protein